MTLAATPRATSNIDRLAIILPFLLLVRQRVALRQFLLRAIKRRYRLSAFGLLWTVIVPLATLGIYTFVFGVVMESRWATNEDAGTYGFSLYLFSGLIVFWVLAEVMSQAPMAVVEHTNLVKKAVFPVEILPPVVVGNAVFHALVNAGVLIAALLILEGRIPLTALLLPIVLLPFVLLLIGLSWIFAAIGVYFRDIVHMVGLFLTGALFISPVFYSTDRLSPALQALIMLNPITFIILQVRLIVLEGEGPDWMGLGLYLIVAWVIASAGLAFFRHARANFADVL
jgi:lipopolysaccharide transport system permease protein